MINQYPYGALITKGLGYDNTIYITSFFHLITVEVSPIPPIIGGGGTTAGPLPYGPFQPYYDEHRRLVRITIHLGGKMWVEEYIVTLHRADVIVNIINLINKWKIRGQINIFALRNSIVRVSAQIGKRTKYS